jgi:hypothetical protein
MINAQGYSMRTDDFRYTEWAKWDGRTQRPVWGVRAEAFPSCTRCIVTEIYLCHACSCHEISRMETPRAGARWARALRSPRRRRRRNVLRRLRERQPRRAACPRRRREAAQRPAARSGARPSRHPLMLSLLCTCDRGGM